MCLNQRVGLWPQAHPKACLLCFYGALGLVRSQRGGKCNSRRTTCTGLFIRSKKNSCWLKVMASIYDVRKTIGYFYPSPLCHCHKSADFVSFVCSFGTPSPHPLRTSYMEAPQCNSLLHVNKSSSLTWWITLYCSELHRLLHRMQWSEWMDEKGSLFCLVEREEKCALPLLASPSLAYMPMHPDGGTDISWKVSVSVVGRYSLSVSGNQQVIGSPCQMVVCHWSPSVAWTNNERWLTQ